ncbi:MAG: hypothetical protein A2626_02760 [Candidatus Nealsonbacteria bacterium RIFCSPHIGHO2_01_FULL_38_55]|uniref:Uncharacterized protein n=2 Tax=Candidatus Nealsoniibacteriota TaxID=1817911 RepID=A0A1G2EH07_9BACT|nr:MAG: hypothetical protein A2626_02760 [Candidatus Nealsonbacteria bacterium RIFCSPHIGHO2_01_FULL_38_55]OGZ24641.1 MAG: hypothetical protein A2W71_02310 [Candidatus Nealsonbacteria bacterium RIFCSPLOWO2_02_39_8]
MNPQRQGEIALKLVKYQLQERGIIFPSQSEIKKVARMIAISYGELFEFMKQIILELVDYYLAVNADNGNDKPKPGVPLGEIFSDADGPKPEHIISPVPPEEDN